MQGKGQMFLTTEQIQRLAALSLDALSGIEFESDCADTSVVTGHYVHIDDEHKMDYFEIHADGSWRKER